MSTPSSRALRNRLIRLRNLRIAGEQDARTPAPTDAPDFGGRWTRRQWAQVSLTATMVALLGTIVPGFASMEQPPVGSPLQTLSLKLPPLSLTRASGTFGDSWHAITVRRGASLKHMFATLGIPEADLKRVLGHPGVKAEVVNWVLKKPAPEQRTAIEDCIARTLKAVPHLLAGEMDKATVVVHTSKPPRPKPPRPEGV